MKLQLITDKPSQVLVTALMSLVILLFAYSSEHLPLRVTADNETILKLAIRHSGMLLGECVVVSQEALQKLAPNMRKPTDCPRGKAPIDVVLEVDGIRLVDQKILASGLHDDGVLALYESLPIIAGKRKIRIQVSHNKRDQIMTESFEELLDVRAEKIIVLDYADQGFRLYQPGGDA